MKIVERVRERRIRALINLKKMLFGYFAKKGNNKFDGIDWSPGATLTPVLKDSYLSIECTTNNVYEGGDHRVVCGEVSQLHFNSDPLSKPLIYFKGKYNALVD